jgi:hypothetical protein
MFQLSQIIGTDFGLQQTPKTPQRSNRIPPSICQMILQTNNKQSKAHSHVVRIHHKSGKSKTVGRSDKMSPTLGGPEIPCQIHFYESKPDRVQTDLHLVHPRKFLPGAYQNQKGAVLPTSVETMLMLTIGIVSHRVAKRRIA